MVKDPGGCGHGRGDQPHWSLWAIRTIAEAVENQATLGCLRDLGVNTRKATASRPKPFGVGSPLLDAGGLVFKPGTELSTNQAERPTMEFKNVPFKHKANVYHAGKVTSRTIITPEGEMKTFA